MTTARWEHYEHEADMGVRGIGPTLSEAFEQAALALTAVITDLERVRARDIVTIECQADDPEILLVDWLNALIYEMATRKMLFRQFAVSIADGQLHATATGEAVEVARHRPAVEPKGATFTTLNVRCEPDADCVAQCVVDV